INAGFYLRNLGLPAGIWRLQKFVVKQAHPIEFLKQGISLHDFVVEVWKRLNVVEFILIHYHGEPKTQLSDFDCARIEVDTVKGVLDRIALQSVSRPRSFGANISLFLQRASQRYSGANYFVHHTDRKSTRTNGRITNGDSGEV